jgi:hypothetical protein
LPAHLLSSISLLRSSSLFKELLFFKSGCKGKQVFLISKFFLKVFFKILDINAKIFHFSTQTTQIFVESHRFLLIFCGFLANFFVDFFRNVDELRTTVGNVFTMWTGCGQPSGMFPQCGRVADNCRERFHNVDGLRTTVGNVSTMWTGCGRPAGTFPQCGRVEDISLRPA